MRMSSYLIFQTNSSILLPEWKWPICVVMIFSSETRLTFDKRGGDGSLSGGFLCLVARAAYFSLSSVRQNVELEKCPT